jgi:hypothetical protein
VRGHVTGEVRSEVTAGPAVGAPRRRTMGGVAAVAALAAVLAAGGCGVQPTGVNVAENEPLGASSSSSPQSAQPSQYPYTVSLFLFSSINKGGGAMINRPVTAQSGPADLLNQLAMLTADEKLDQYTTYVPAGITIKQTPQAHMYYVNSPIKLSPLAQQQLTCTLDQWWIQHPDPTGAIRPSTRLIFQNTGEDTGWQDCLDGIVQNGPDEAPAAKPSAAVVTGRATPGN